MRCAHGPPTRLSSSFSQVLLNDVIESIFDSAHAAPPVLRYICGCLQKSVSSKWPDNEIVRTRVVSVFIFLRLLSPAIRYGRPIFVQEYEPGRKGNDVCINLFDYIGFEIISIDGKYFDISLIPRFNCSLRINFAGKFT